MKLLVISHAFPNSIYPMSDMFVLNQLKSLRNLGVELKVISPVPYSPRVTAFLRENWTKYYQIEEWSDQYGFEVFYTRSLQLPGRWFRYYEGIAAYLSTARKIRCIRRNFEFEAVLANMLILDGFVAARIGKKYGVPSLCYAVGSDINVYPFESPAVYERTQQILEDLDQVLSVSDGLRDRINEIYPTFKKMIEVVPRGIDLNTFQSRRNQLLRSRLDISDECIIGLYVGGLSREKGINDLLQALALLKNERFRMVMVGDGPLRAYAEAFLKAHGLGQKCHVMGYIDFSELPDIYSSADFFVFPSHHEGLPNVLVEAAASGLPIIASEIPGNTEVVLNEYNGLLFKPGDCERMSSHIELMAGDVQLRSKMSDNSRRVSERKFDIRKNARTLIKIIKRTIKVKGES